MAIIATYTDPKTGATYPDSYWKAKLTLEGHKPILGSFDIYASEVAREDGKEPISSFPIFVIAPEGADPRQAYDLAYAYGMALPDMTNKRTA